MLLVFLTSNVGIPVVKYICPMMEEQECAMGDHRSANEPSINYPPSDCCAGKIVAERNTTPFLKHQSEISIGTAAIPLIAACLPAPHSFSPITIANESPPILDSQPLFLLNASLLI
ncbi:MAG: hypothetical protein HY966_02290 [Ignavibacteriales bacterium]|nr:hypothetical protein [Ignavibacteriales bacterium]